HCPSPPGTSRWAAARSPCPPPRLHLPCSWFSFSPFIGVLDGRPMWMQAEMTGDAPNAMALATWTRRHGQEGADTRELITHSAPALMGLYGWETDEAAVPSGC